MNFASTTNFFDLLRFDFLLDERLNLFLLQVNTNPNVHSSSNHVEAMNEDVLANLFNLIGLKQFNETINEDDVKVELETCNSDPCDDDCTVEKCKLCWQCLDNNQRFDIKMAYGEQKRIGKFKRLLPDVNADTTFARDSNKYHQRWFKVMCEKDKRFC